MRYPVVAGLLQKEGKVLLAKRPAHKKRGGLWEFPGGKVEEGEAPREALRRELLEELGILVEVGEEVAVVDYDYPEVAIRLTCFSCQIKEGEPRALEGQELGWFEPEEIDNISLAPADVSLWRNLRKTLLQR
ncbi:MAG TPA: (deoxy)nucleoside triphosphate pyrophosphohydrolase [Thermodesulfatator atlanticus]|uniref:8-oxo-dGTP diphosphatase n=1 Tax=Thermodesulfatator atlanticus TaxID=501497 RepID=A0A7V5NY18_9BACT|nr:(deoxy)nucleoside triphosphate pyrophosphohydrolase [Thermodesulfatator atlanticus]